MILYLTIAKAQLPESGTVAWWSAEKGDFESIQVELDDIIIHTRSISSLDSSNEHFASVMLDIHARLETIEKDLVSF